MNPVTEEDRAIILRLVSQYRFRCVLECLMEGMNTGTGLPPSDRLSQWQNFRSLVNDCAAAEIKAERAKRKEIHQDK